MFLTSTPHSKWRGVFAAQLFSHRDFVLLLQREAVFNLARLQTGLVSNIVFNQAKPVPTCMFSTESVCVCVCVLLEKAVGEENKLLSEAARAWQK